MIKYRRLFGCRYQTVIRLSGGLVPSPILRKSRACDMYRTLVTSYLLSFMI